MAASDKRTKSGLVSRRSALLRAALLDAISEATIKAVAETLTASAMDGHLPAIKLLLEYAAGRPAQAREVPASSREPSAIDWDQLRTALLNALTPYDDARVAVAAALDFLAHDRATRVPREGV